MPWWWQTHPNSKGWLDPTYKGSIIPIRNQNCKPLMWRFYYTPFSLMDRIHFKLHSPFYLLKVSLWWGAQFTAVRNHVLFVLAHRSHTVVGSGTAGLSDGVLQRTLSWRIIWPSWPHGQHHFPLPQQVLHRGGLPLPWPLRSPGWGRGQLHVLVSCVHFTHRFWCSNRHHHYRPKNK